MRGGVIASLNISQGVSIPDQGGRIGAESGIHWEIRWWWFCGKVKELKSNKRAKFVDYLY